MLRVLTLITAILTAAPSIGAPVKADPVKTLDQASQTVMIEQAGVHLTAFYDEQVGGTLNLTVLITDADGDTLRTRIALKNRQHHTVLLPGRENDQHPVRIEFLRTGPRVEMVVSGDDTGTDVARSGARSHF